MTDTSRPVTAEDCAQSIGFVLHAAIFILLGGALVAIGVPFPILALVVILVGGYLIYQSYQVWKGLPNA
jgi:hypothetical protein